MNIKISLPVSELNDVPQFDEDVSWVLRYSNYRSLSIILTYKKHMWKKNRFC